MTEREQQVIRHAEVLADWYKRHSYSGEWLPPTMRALLHSMCNAVADLSLPPTKPVFPTNIDVKTGYKL
jgi:hypothetical protein